MTNKSLANRIMPRKYFLKFLFLAVFALLPATPVSAWDDTGHKVSAYIAWQKMTPQARETTIKLLLAAPEDSHLSAYYLSGSRSRGA